MNKKRERVVNSETGEIKIIKELLYTGLAYFTDGTQGDVHQMDKPDNQLGKKWKWIEEEEINEEVNNSYYEIY
jgi:hypothetical protein